MSARPSPPSPLEPAATHAGGVVFHETLGEYLLVRPKAGLPEWVFPKGHIERGETAAAAAIREVREETGVVATVVARVGQVSFQVRQKNVLADYFLMRCVATESADEEREIGWFGYAEALIALTHANNREILRKAEAIRISTETNGER